MEDVTKGTYTRKALVYQVYKSTSTNTCVMECWRPRESIGW